MDLGARSRRKSSAVSSTSYLTPLWPRATVITWPCTSAIQSAFSNTARPLRCTSINIATSINRISVSVSPAPPEEGVGGLIAKPFLFRIRDGFVLSPERPNRWFSTATSGQDRKHVGHPVAFELDCLRPLPQKVS